MVLGQSDTRSLGLLVLRRPTTSETAADHAEPTGEPRPPQLPHREELMPMIAQTPGCSVAHDFGAAEPPVIGAADIAPLGNIRRGYRLHQVARRTAHTETALLFSQQRALFIFYPFDYRYLCNLYF